MPPVPALLPAETEYVTCPAAVDVAWHWDWLQATPSHVYRVGLPEQLADRTMFVPTCGFWLLVRGAHTGIGSAVPPPGGGVTGPPPPPVLEPDQYTSTGVALV